MYIDGEVLSMKTPFSLVLWFHCYFRTPSPPTSGCVHQLLLWWGRRVRTASYQLTSTAFWESHIGPFFFHWLVTLPMLGRPLKCFEPLLLRVVLSLCLPEFFWVMQVLYHTSLLCWAQCHVISFLAIELHRSLCDTAMISRCLWRHVSAISPMALLKGLSLRLGQRTIWVVDPV